MTNLHHDLYRVGTEGYAPINSELVFVKVKSVEVHIKDKGGKHNYVLALPNGNDMELSECHLSLYKSEKDYEEGNPMDYATVSNYTILKDLGLQAENRGDDEVVGYTYVFENNDAKELEVNIRIVKWECGKGISAVEGDKIPEKHYESRADAFKFNDYKVVEADGTRRVVRSLYQAMQLNEEQKALIEEQKALLERMKSAGIRLIFDNEWDKYYAINVNEIDLETGIDEWTIENDEKKDIKHGDLFRSEDVSDISDGMRIDHVWVNCDYGFCAKIKE